MVTNRVVNSTAKQWNDARTASTPHMGAREWWLLLALSVIWGGSFFFIKVAVHEVTPLTVVLLRVGVAALLLQAYVYLTGRKMPTSSRTWGSYFLMGLLTNALPFSLIVWGQQYIDSSLASILNAASPIFSVFLAHLLTHDEPMTVPRVIGVLLGWAGVAMLIGFESLQGLGLHVWGQLAVIGAALSYAFSAIYGKRFKGTSSVVLAAGMLTSATVIMLPLVIVFEHPLAISPSAQAWGAMLGLTVVSTALAYLIYFRLLASAGATNALLVTFLIPVTAILLGVTILGERPDWHAFGGLVLILVGLGAIDGRLVAKLRAARQRTTP